MPAQGGTSFLRTIGSLWLAVILLVILGVSMAAATVIESRAGTEQALAAFYHARWFMVLLALLAVNLTAAVLSRPILTRRQAGFLMTHLAVLLIFGGALLTQEMGVQGRLTIAEGETASAFQLSNRPVLAIARPSDRFPAECPLDPAVFAGLEERSDPGHLPLVCGDVRVEIRRYLPDAAESRRMIDDPVRGQPAVEVALSASPHDFQGWVFAGETAKVGAMPVAFRSASTNEELEQWLGNASGGESRSKGTLKLEYEGRTYTLPIEECLERQAAVGDTGYTIQVTRYVPHATVGDDKTIVSASSQPVNPYIEATLAGPEGTQARRAFAKFPDFDGMHGAATAQAVKLRYEVPETEAPLAPAEVLAGVDGRLYARFSQPGLATQTIAITPGTPVETPWEGWQFAVRQTRERARWEQVVTSLAPPRKDGRQPALELTLVTPRGERTAVARYGRPAAIEVDGQSCEIRFGDAAQMLDFQVTLEAFRVVTHPGLQKPRSYESRVTIRDPRAGGEISRVISMNNPLDYGGYTFFQSSFLREGDSFVSVLSVSRDPGRIVVFAGYMVLMAGMILVLLRRMAEARKADAATTP